MTNDRGRAGRDELVRRVGVLHLAMLDSDGREQREVLVVHETPEVLAEALYDAVLLAHLYAVQLRQAGLVPGGWSE